MIELIQKLKKMRIKFATRNGVKYGPMVRKVPIVKYKPKWIPRMIDPPFFKASGHSSFFCVIPFQMIIEANEPMTQGKGRSCQVKYLAS